MHVVDLSHYEKFKLQKKINKNNNNDNNNKKMQNKLLFTNISIKCLQIIKNQLIARDIYTKIYHKFSVHTSKLS